MSSPSEKAKEKEIEEIISSMKISTGGRVKSSDIAQKHNDLVEHAVGWVYILRQRHHDVDGLIHSVQEMLKFTIKSQDELKDEHKLTRVATDNNTTQIAKLVTIGETTLFWFKIFLGVGGLALVSALVKWLVS